VSSGFVLDQVGVTVDGRSVLVDVDAEVPHGRCTALVGPSGAGKTTLLRLLNRLGDPTAGRITLDGVGLPDLDVLALRRRVGLVAQRPVLLTDTVADELRVGRLDLPTARAAELLTMAGLPDGFHDRTCAGLSGGEAQRVCLARELAVSPQVLLLDEPTSALDGPAAGLIADLIRRHIADAGTVVLISHDPELVRRAADRALSLRDGRIATTTSTD
jgi:putative ABC transport system ATP-binding protein